MMQSGNAGRILGSREEKPQRPLPGSVALEYVSLIVLQDPIFLVFHAWQTGIWSRARHPLPRCNEMQLRIYLSLPIIRAIFRRNYLTYKAPTLS